jgi:hypothetical protein
MQCRDRGVIKQTIMTTRVFKITFTKKDYPVFQAILISNGIAERRELQEEADNYCIILHDPWIKQVYDLLCDCNEAGITLIISKA